MYYTLSRDGALHFILCTMSWPPALSRSELGQGLNHFLDRAVSSTWPDRVCWSRLVVVNCIAIMMAFLNFRAHFGLRSQCFLKRPSVTRTEFPLFFNPFLSDFHFLNFPCSSDLFLYGLGFFSFSNFPNYRVGLFWVTYIFLYRLELLLMSPILVSISSSSPVYLCLFWSSWVPCGRCNIPNYTLTVL